MFNNDGEVLLAALLVMPGVIMTLWVASLLWRTNHGKHGLCILAAFLTMVAFSKWIIGGDDDLHIVGGDVTFTNNLTQVNFYFTGNNVTTATPVHVRMSNTNQWTEVTRLYPTVTTDLATNVYHFAIAGDWRDYTQVWVGHNTPAVIIEETGITVTSFIVDSHNVYIAWTCDDSRATLFKVQDRVYNKRNRTWGEWGTVGTVDRADEMHFSVTGFTVDKTRQWRVISEFHVGD